ncbi:MAG: FAD-dependent thymidylate synthase [Candidatus Pacearchaeota archaeon]|nr:FAD-dependent thymidylate synthase [Candidatus Pacearchaeota archaeon]
MDVKLAGFNVDRDAIDELKKILSNDELSKENRLTALNIVSNLTPETICASYARISRDPRVISELRADARKDVEASRKSNKAIIFTMGHKSIAEHARFNFDIVGISRRAIEEIEQNRLDSYTEKSQRYITMEGDFVLPKEIKNTKFESQFLELVELQNNFYKNNLEKITNWHHGQDYSKLYPTVGAKDEEKQKGVREGLGKEDARYSLGLSTQAQLGMTISARTLENMITRLRSSDNEELKEVGEKLFAEVDGVAPSVIKYTQPSDYFAKTRPELKQFVSKLIEEHGIQQFVGTKRVNLFTKRERDDSIIAGLIFSSSHLNYGNCFAIEREMSQEDKISLLKQTMKYQEKHDPMLREYELGDRVAEMIMSSSAFAQMKRHRMNTLISQEYNPELGLTVPESITKTGLSKDLEYVVKKSVELHNNLLSEGYSKSVADYVLTNANRRRVLFDANNRQAHAFCMERENLAAQWDIRKTANEYHRALQEVYGGSCLTTRVLCGKHEFDEVKRMSQE